MSDASADRIKIDPDDLVDAFERARRSSSSGDRAWRITPTQRVDLHRLVAALRGKNGPAREGAPLEVWLNYLAPVLAESGPARSLLREVLLEFVLPSEPPPPPDSERLSLWARLCSHLTRALVLTVVCSLILLVGPTESLNISERDKTGWVARPIPGHDRSDLSFPPYTKLNVPASDAYRDAMAVSRRLLRAPNIKTGGLTPRQLAAGHAGVTPALGTPDTLLVAMLRGWPVPPDEPITPDARGIITLKRLTAEVAAISGGLPRVLFEDLITQDSGIAPLPVASSPTTAQNAWSRWWLALGGLPLVVFVLFATLLFRRRCEDLVERWIKDDERAIGGPPAVEGIRHASGPLECRLPEPSITRESLRRLMRYRPIVGKRLDERRSVRAVVRQAGYADPVMRKVQHVIDYLILVQRWQTHDHERMRVRHLVDVLAKKGLSISVYDYERDPLMARRAVRPENREQLSGFYEREEMLDLPTLRDLHPNSRLVLVTDGRDLVDRVTGRVRDEVVRSFSFWSERMVLTPVPVGDWGEVELALSRDLDAPLGRATQSMATDLARGFQSVFGQARHRLALERARGVPGLRKLDAWWQEVASEFGSDAALASGPHLLPDNPLIVTDLVPARGIIRETMAALRRWLGPRGFLWHAACAVYPQLRFDLTVHIGTHLRAALHDDAPVLFRDLPGDRRVFERLTALPWFRAGRMPEWLRREALSQISADDLKRASNLIRKLFGASSSEPQTQLAIWWPFTGALTIPPDAVMASALDGNVRVEAPRVRPEREVLLRNAARSAIFWQDAQIGGLLAGAGLGAAWLAPDLAKNTQSLGAWLPVLGFLLACVGASLLVFLLRRAAPALPRPALANSQTAPESGEALRSARATDAASDRETPR